MKSHIVEHSMLGLRCNDFVSLTILTLLSPTLREQGLGWKDLIMCELKGVKTENSMHKTVKGP